MAQGKIIVETSRLDSTAAQVERLSDQYKREYDSLFGTVRDLQNAFDGEDYVAFTNQIEGFHDDFQRMERLMREYAAFLRKAAESYRTTQDDAVARAKTLSQGS